jgi:ABC-type branched-subunit amino acid transport system substrate-binding protein
MLALQPVSPSRASEDSGSPDLGRQLFFEGKKDGRDPLTANVGAASVPVPATALPCAGCHGRDGLGRPEGGVRPSDITWFNLSREYGGVTAQGRRYQAYDEDRFLRAVSEGIDSSGNLLDSSMPRYNISRREARDLIAYLKVIQDDFDPGISDDAIVVGTLQPDAGIQARTSAAMLEVMRARLAEINRDGGVYGRRLDLEVLTYDDRESFIAQSNRMIDDDGVFALINVFSSSADDSLSRLVESGEVPSIAPYTQFPAPGEGGMRYTFYLHGGLIAQIESLIRHAAATDSSSPAFVLYRRNGAFAGIAERARELMLENGFDDTRLVGYEARPPQRLSELVPSDSSLQPLLLFVGSSAELVALAGSEMPAVRPPRLLLPGYFVSGEVMKLPAIYAQALEMSYVTVLDGGDGRQLDGFREFMQRNNLQPNFLNSRLYAFSATEILAEAVKRAGKRLTRKKLVTAMEEFYAFDAGLNRPVSFTRQRRIAMNGAYIVRLDAASRRLIATDNWIGLD